MCQLEQTKSLIIIHDVRERGKLTVIGSTLENINQKNSDEN
jgi:hypothetical protein